MIDTYIVIMFYIYAYCLGVLVITLGFGIATTWLLEKIYAKVWQWELLIRTAHHCRQRTWLKPPGQKMKKVDGILRTSDELRQMTREAAEGEESDIFY